MLIFVHGTLKRGEPNAWLMEKVNAKFIGRARTVQSYPMVIGTDFNIPAILHKPGFTFSCFDSF